MSKLDSKGKRRAWQHEMGLLSPLCLHADALQITAATVCVYSLGLRGCVAVERRAVRGTGLCLPQSLPAQGGPRLSQGGLCGNQ